ncbi:bifunctional phosphopantothenoylcysteine decarboxylase/phosphopantothenate--cysteine ligase CoaBC [Aphanothece hegewaldii CCALA 016]|uniref:Coenzyme A biosynthesis bifunctional protein CoaBC n=1 Tax=Aphanothece hegewaldii CCALA 016 TaxID=2107694 RepID=A0A2T1LSW9_9CHRO|nr:bifunctional phosphopantothenoylcysteine decarboxylase/phosphopantothenate--cysteine ligase CoaBC [Aphanothece hegewaldii]PSF33156.1 bifunctional phosphopantothenoylcysteine decarboxylase/phosphopantothenate--cysteine ligase CoaBC [Aphanothece hegewaldii CCALA 016]
MKIWDFTPPPESDLEDHDVPLDGYHLQNKRIALLVTGGIAAMKAPILARALRRYGAQVVAFTSDEALRYTTIDTLAWSTNNPVITHLTPAAEHLSDRTPFDLYLVAPATYNTINKMRYGIADGVITTTLASAIGRMEQGKTKIMIVPTMHGSLHNSILTESLKTLHQMGIAIMPPREDYGKHNLPPEKEITVEVCRLISHSPLQGMNILITGGPTPVLIDSIRRITNRFTGHLGVEITEELYLRGANVHLIHGQGSYQPPSYLPYQIIDTYDEYLTQVLNTLSDKKYDVGIFTAAVADYKPEEILVGKTPSGGVLKTINLVPTIKIIEVVKDKFPDLSMITFKYQENVSHEKLIEIAQNRLNKGYSAVIANRGEEFGNQGEQIAYLVTANQEPQKMISKKQIAVEIANYIEQNKK